MAILVASALPALPACAMDAGIYTIVDDARVLRGATWFRLVPGARLLEGDVLDVDEQGQAQIELADGTTLNAQGSAAMHAASLAPLQGKPPAAVTEIAVVRGWLKAAAPKGRPLRVRMATMTVTIADAVIVARCDEHGAELFVESGTASIALPRSKEAPLDATADAFVTRADDRAPVVANRAPAAFLTAMPRPFRDALPKLAARFAAAPEALVKGRDISLAEADPWLAGASRKGFIRRFTARLADPAFRAGVAARPAAYPEWDRIVHPEKYRPKETTDANPRTGSTAEPAR